MDDAADDAAIEDTFLWKITVYRKIPSIETPKEEEFQSRETIPALEDLFRWVALFLR